MISIPRRSSSAIRPVRRVSRRGVIPGVDPLEARELLTLLGDQLFPSDNPWNQNIAAAPVASNSSAIINNIISLYGNGHFHPDFGQDTQSSNPLYGIPFNVVHGNTQPKVNVVIGAYASESDVQPAPIPANAVLEGDDQNGPVAGLANRGDSHLIVWDEDNNIAYEFFQASRPSENSDGQWHADQESVWNMNTDTFRTIGWTSADAAGLAILPGLVRPDEALPVSQGGQGVIDHAIRITLQNNIILDQFLYPASHIADSGSNAAVQPPMGARLRLKASVDISQLDPESKVIAQAMKTYGVIVADNGSNFFATGASYSVDANNNLALTWDDNDIQDTTHGLKSLTYSDFEVVDLTPVVTGLSATSGSAGQTITVTGSNFSGAAGHLQVLFGGTAATNVTVIDDSHVSAVVPAGTGTVDVRVQSGITSPDSENINDPVFGYGTSAVTTADQFTYGGSTGNQAPTIAQPASASPNPVTGTTTNLSVLGADDGGEANLTYTWQATAVPSGASPVFSANGTNAAKNTVVTFNGAGAYTFLVTVRDVQGLTVTSSVNVTVNQTLTTIWSPTATPQTADAADGNSVELGVRFTPAVSGTITGLRFYKGPLNTGTHVADLWTSSGALLATATFTNETASGWQQVNFSSPIAVTAGTTYVASYHTNVGQYADNKNYFTSAYTSGPLQVPANGGVYSYGTAGTFPRNSYQASNYWVDIVLAPGSSTGTVPAVTSETPASGATGVAVNAPLTATFNEAVQPGSISFTLTGPGSTAVPAALSYNASTNTATLTPLSSLVAGTSYTATVSGATDTSGDVMASPLSWTFTTSASYGPGPFSIWSGAAAPQTADAADGASVELGVRFTSSVSGTITGLRFYKGSLNTGTHVADLWSSAGTLLATATFTGETASGWQQVSFSQPVAVTAGTTYVASYHTNVGQYADNKNYFTSAYTSGPLQVPANGGVYSYGAAGTFPRNSYVGSNYWVDVVLAPNSGATVSGSVQPGAVGLASAGPIGTVSPSVGSGASTGIATLVPSAILSVSTTGTATGQGAGVLAIGALNFGDDATSPTAGASPSASDRVVRIRWRR